MVEEDEATKVLREELKKRLQASIIAYGDAGVMLHKFIQDFKEDHSKDLEVAAKRLGQDGVVQLLRMFPEYIRVIEQDDGHVKLRGIPTEDTKYNMNIISESNKAVERERMAMVYARTRQARARSIPTRIVIPPAASFPQTSAQIRPPPPPPGMEIPPIPASPPPAATYQFSFGMQPLQKPPVPPEKAKTPTKKPSRVTPPPPVGEVKNANRIPLGTRRPFSQQNNQQPPNLSRPSSQATGGYGHGGGRSSSMHAHRQQYQSHFSKSVPGRNDFGDTLVARCCAAAAQQRRSHPPPPPPAHLDENGRAPSAAKTTIEYHPDDYYEEDFRSPPSNKASNSTASGRSSGLGDDYYDDEDKSESESEFGDDEDLLESWNDDDHWDIDVQVDPARRDEDSVECFNFMDSKFGQQLRASAPSDLYRLVHLFRKNGGSYSKMDDLKKDYQQTFGTALTSKELNRMLGSPENVKIVKESFKKCAYPGSALFSITETANNYTVELLSSLAKDFVDSSIFFLPANAHQPLPCFSPPPPLTPSTTKGSPTPSGTGTPTKRPQTAAGGAPSNTEGNNSSKGEQPFAALAILAHKELRLARKKRTLAELRRHILNIIKPGQFPQVLVESEANLLGYLLEFFRDSFSLEFQENNLYIMPTNVSPSYKFPPPPPQPQSVYPFEGFMRADDIHRVTIVAQQDGPNLVLRLPEIKRQLAMCFSKYQGLMKAVADRPPVPLEPNYPIFYMFNGRLCRGRAVSQNAEDYATVSDLDAMNHQHFVPLKDIYAVDANFPGWRYPPVDFCGRILNGEPSRLQQLAATKEEFPVRVMRVLEDGKCELKMVDEYDD